MSDASSANAVRSHHDGAATPPPVAVDDMYAVALEDLLSHAVRPPSVLDRLKRVIWSQLMSIHNRKNKDVNRLPPEYWFWHH